MFWTIIFLIFRNTRLCVTDCDFNLIFVIPCIMLYRGEISPTRCKNCVFYSQWLYCTCFGWQSHPSSGVQCCIWPQVSCQWPATSWGHYITSCNTQSSAPEDEQNNFPKHVELTGIVNKPLLLHLVDYLFYLYQCCTVKQISDNEIYLLMKYIKSFLWRVAKRLSYIQDARRLKLNVKQN